MEGAAANCWLLPELLLSVGPSLELPAELASEEPSGVSRPGETCTESLLPAAAELPLEPLAAALDGW
jgi:hypothetical protein